MQLTDHENDSPNTRMLAAVDANRRLLAAQRSSALLQIEGRVSDDDMPDNDYE